VTIIARSFIKLGVVMRMIRKIFFLVMIASIFVKANPMAHNWAHYKSGGSEICICAHMEAIIEYFKDQKDLTMVLGAGNLDIDYTRFANYRFVVSNEIKEYKILKSDTIESAVKDLTQKLAGGQKEPLLIPFDFNSKEFFNFLDSLGEEKFQQIIFDYSATKFVHWGLPQICGIFNALQEGGELYFENNVGGGGAKITVAELMTTKQDDLPITMADTPVNRLSKCIDIIDDYIICSYENFIAHHSLLFPPEYKITSERDTLKAGDNVEAISNLEFRVPSGECHKNYILHFLNKAGFI
jgi:hypothetical protein